MLVGFSPRKANLTVWLMGGHEKRAALLGKLGKHTLGKGCPYFRRRADVGMKVLKQVIQASVKTPKTL